MKTERPAQGRGWAEREGLGLDREVGHRRNREVRVSSPEATVKRSMVLST